MGDLLAKVPEVFEEGAAHFLVEDEADELSDRLIVVFVRVDPARVNLGLV